MPEGRAPPSLGFTGSGVDESLFIRVFNHKILNFKPENEPIKALHLVIVPNKVLAAVLNY